MKKIFIISCVIFISFVSGYFTHKNFPFVGLLRNYIFNNNNNKERIATHEEKKLFSCSESFRKKYNLRFIHSREPENMPPSKYFSQKGYIFLKDYYWAKEFINNRKTTPSHNDNLLNVIGLNERDFGLKDINFQREKAYDDFYRVTLNNSLTFHAVYKIPKVNSTQTAILFLHGHSTNPFRLFDENERDYLNAAGKVLLNHGFAVMAPYLFSQSWGNTNITEYGYLNGNGISSYGLDVIKVRALISFLKARYKNVVVYGISRGGMIAQISAILFNKDIDILVLSGVMFDYKKYLNVRIADMSLPNYYHDPYLISGNRSNVIEQYFQIENVVEKIAPLKLILEFSTDISLDERIEAFRKIQSMYLNRKENLKINFFEGFHETNPEVTTNMIYQLITSNK